MRSVDAMRKVLANIPLPIALKLSVNRTLNTVASTAKSVREKTEQLIKLLQQAKARSPQSFESIALTIADKIVDQATSRIHLSQSSAFPFAMLAALICVYVPEFTEILMGVFAERCIYIVPRYLDRQDFKGNADQYRLALGYTQDKENKQTGFEEEDKYFEKMGGYVSLYAAFMQTDIAKHPHGLDQAWVWVSRLLNQAPRTATASILLAFLEVSGYGLLKAYPQQFPKLLDFIERHFLPRLDDRNPARKAAKTRLGMFLQDYRTNKRLAEPKGKTLPADQASDVGYQDPNSA